MRAGTQTQSGGCCPTFAIDLNLPCVRAEHIELSVCTAPRHQASCFLTIDVQVAELKLRATAPSSAKASLHAFKGLEVLLR